MRCSNTNSVTINNPNVPLTSSHFQPLIASLIKSGRKSKLRQSTFYQCCISCFRHFTEIGFLKQDKIVIPIRKIVLTLRKLKRKNKKSIYLSLLDIEIERLNKILILRRFLHQTFIYPNTEKTLKFHI